MQRGHDCSQYRLAGTLPVGLISRRVLGATPGHAPASHHLSHTAPVDPHRVGGGFIFSRLASMYIVRCVRASRSPPGLGVHTRAPPVAGPPRPKWLSMWNNSSQPVLQAPMLEFVVIKRR